MAAAYDTYDYPSYWVGRDYEHQSEVLAIKTLLNKISKIRSILEIGAGYGRLTPSYLYRAKKVTLADPSSKLLSLAKKNLSNKQIKYLHSSLSNLPKRLRAKSVDLVIMVRVLHHITNLEQSFKIIYQLLKPGGYLILEFANKSHLKATLKEFVQGNLTFPLDITPIDKRSLKSIKKKTLPFINYHPDVIKHELKENGFTLIDCLSVSNIRSSFLKRSFKTKSLLTLERYLQKPFSLINFGPSIFLLAQKHKIG